MTIHVFADYTKIADTTKPFYADEFNLRGCDMSALSHAGLIRPTGNTKEVFIPTYDKYGFIAEAKEWVVVPMPIWQKYSLKKVIESARQIAAFYNSHADFLGE